jgi:hypothetical protein
MSSSDDPPRSWVEDTAVALTPRTFLGGIDSVSRPMGGLLLLPFPTTMKKTPSSFSVVVVVVTTPPPLSSRRMLFFRCRPS